MGARGERTFQAGPNQVTVLFTNRALANAEKRLGKGIIAIAQGLVSGQTELGDIVVLLHVGMEAARVDSRSTGRSISMDDAYRVIDDAGFAAVAGPVLESVAEVLGYSADDGAIEGTAQVEGPDPKA